MSSVSSVESATIVTSQRSIQDEGPCRAGAALVRLRPGPPGSCVLGRTHIYLDMGAPCVLASRRPSSASRRAITLNRAQRAAEDDLGLAERYPVAVAKLFPLDPTSVQERPVHRAEVDDPVGRARLRG